MQSNLHAMPCHAICHLPMMMYTQTHKAYTTSLGKVLSSLGFTYLEMRRISMMTAIASVERKIETRFFFQQFECSTSFSFILHHSYLILPGQCQNTTTVAKTPSCMFHVPVSSSSVVSITF